MKRRLSTAVLILALIMLSGCSSGDDAQSPVHPDDLPTCFVMAETHPGRCFFADLSRDGRYACLEPGRDATINSSYLIVHGSDGSDIDQINFFNTESVQPWFVDDFNHDGDQDLFLVTSRGDSLFAVIVDALHANHSKPLLTIPLYQPPHRTRGKASDVSATLRGLREREGGKLPLLIATTSAGFSLTPREVMAFDLSTGKKVWSFASGAPVVSLAMASPTSDSLPAIFIGTTAPDNGAERNGFNDAHSYLLALSGEGKLMWSRKMGEKFSNVQVSLSDIDGDGNEEMIAYVIPGKGDQAKCRLIAANPKTGGEIARKEFSEPMAGYTHFGTVSQNKRFQQFAFCTRSGKMLLLDHDFSLIANREIGTKVSDVALYDLTADGERKIVLTLEKGGELVLKPDLEPLAFISPKELPAGFGGIEVNVGSRERARFALLGTTTVVGSLEPNPSRFARWFRLLGNILAGLAAIAIVGYIALRGVVYRGVYRALGRGERNVGLLLLTRHGRVVEVNEGLWNLLQLQHDIKPGRRWQSVFTRGEIAPFADFLKRGLAATMDTEGRMDLSMEGTTSNFVVRSYPIFIGPIRTGTLIALGDLTKTFQADRLMNWALVAQNLAHEMKTPLSTIRFTLERIRQALRTPKELTLQEVEPHLGSIEEEVQRLDQYVRGFLKLANLNPPNFQRCDINAVLDERLSGYGEKMPPSIRLEKEYAQELPLVDLDVNLFTTVVTNLLDNALAAMKGEGKLRISTYLACMLNREWVCCSFADTGCGIADADIAKVFEPYFTKASAGTGLGLVITKKIVEDHGGSITFHTRLGFGTEFIVRLPGRDRGAGHG